MVTIVTHPQLSFQQNMSFPKDFLNSEFGERRVEVVASVIDANEIHRKDVFTKTIQLNMADLPEDDNDQQSGSQICQSLIVPQYNSQHTIPAGAIIHSVTISKATTKALDPKLSIAVGYFDAQVTDPNSARAIIFRVINDLAPLTGVLLNTVGTIKLSEECTKDKIASYVAILNADLSSKNKPLISIDSSLLGATDCIGELHPLIPCATILSGTCASGDISFQYDYTLPRHISL